MKESEKIFLHYVMGILREAGIEILYDQEHNIYQNMFDLAEVMDIDLIELGDSDIIKFVQAYQEKIFSMPEALI